MKIKIKGNSTQMSEKNSISELYNQTVICVTISPKRLISFSFGCVKLLEYTRPKVVYSTPTKRKSQIDLLPFYAATARPDSNEAEARWDMKLWDLRTIDRPTVFCLCFYTLSECFEWWTYLFEFYIFFFRYCFRHWRVQKKLILNSTY